MTNSIKEVQAAEAAPAPHVDQHRLTESEQRCFEKLRERSKANAPVPAIKVAKSDSGQVISLDHPNRIVGFALLMDSLGTVNPHFAEGIKSQLFKISSKNGEINETDLNFALSVVTGVKPNDQNDAMFGVLMAACYLSALKMAEQLFNAPTLEEQDSAERAFNKCTRTFAILSDTLMRKPSGSEQTVVQNVSVSDNAQAFVANVNGSKTKAPREKPMSAHEA